MLTAAVRDLHRTNPGGFAIDVRTSAPDLWAHNPYLTSLPDGGNDVEVIDCEYPAIHESNRLPVHFVEAFHSFLSMRLQREAKLTEFKGDVHLSEQERENSLPHLEALAG